MKPGDIVWLFQKGTQQIKTEPVLEVAELADGILWLSTRTECGILNRDFFLTREALCEHYRKIFE